MLAKTPIWTPAPKANRPWPEIQKDMEAAEQPDDGRRWYALHCEPNRERVATAHLIARRFKTYLPTEAVTETYAVQTMFGAQRRKRTVIEPIFRGFVFIRFCFEQDDARRRHIQTAPGIHNFFRVRGQPASIRNDDMRKIENIEKVLANPKKQKGPNAAFALSELVRVSDGPFIGFNGTIESFDKDTRLTVLLSMFGRAVPITLDTYQIEKL